MKFKPLSEKDESVAKEIVDSAFSVHKNLGPGLLVPKGIASPKKVYSPRWILVFLRDVLFQWAYN